MGITTAVMFYGQHPDGAVHAAQSRNALTETPYARPAYLMLYNDIDITVAFTRF